MFKESNIRDTEKAKTIKKLVFFIILDILIFSISSIFERNEYVMLYIGIRMVSISLSFIQIVIVILKYLLKIIKKQFELIYESDEIYEVGDSSTLRSLGSLSLLTFELFILAVLMDPIVKNFLDMTINDLMVINTLICLLLFEVLVSLVGFRIKLTINKLNISN